VGVDSQGGVPRRSQRALQKQRTQTTLLQVRKKLQVELGRDPTKSEIARAAGVTPALVTRYWDTIGVGEVPDHFLESLTTTIARHDIDEASLIVLGRTVLGLVENLSDGDVELVRLEAKAQAASPQAEALRYETLNLRWRPVLAAALAQRAGRSEPTGDEDRAVGRFILILLDAVARWQELDFEGHVAVPAREAIKAAIPRFESG
jgi:AcrR family transcriptional regulator